MTKGNDSTGELLNEVHQAGMRAAGLTRQLLAFSRRSIVSVSLVHVNELLREMDQMLRRLIGEDVEITMLLSSGLPPVKADPSQIEQLVLNLAVNSRDAMPTGGKIIIESHHAVLDEKYADAHIEVDPGEYVFISVSDNGCGMDEATRLRIFDPFFTTKEQGRGTGLGLSTVYGIVKQSGGHISCYSEVGHGTTFKIYLPVVIDTNGMRNLRPDTMPVSLKGNESILLVEDEDGVRALAKRVLEQAGYQVIEARDGKEVSEKLASLAGPLQLVVTDVVLPTLSGREIAEMVKVMYPKVRVLYASGYTDDAVVRYGVLRSEMPFIHKPFTPQALLRKVREVLDAPTDRPTGQDV